ncbi:MAG: hypothetical protein MUF43_02180 [Flavobacterium sp.]|jgi:hypothetical protein|nr:hypothetical protein [Flavobacterium sp.]
MITSQLIHKIDDLIQAEMAQIQEKMDDPDCKQTYLKEEKVELYALKKKFTNWKNQYYDRVLPY